MLRGVPRVRAGLRGIFDSHGVNEILSPAPICVRRPVRKLIPPGRDRGALRGTGFYLQHEPGGLMYNAYTAPYLENFRYQRKLWEQSFGNLSLTDS